jgi:hypothetical protein
MELQSWAGSIDLTTPAAELLRKLVAALPRDREFTITVFGSAPIQICVDSSLTSADVDVFSDFEPLREITDQAGLGQDKAASYVQVSSELNFRTSPRWRDRAQSARIGNVNFVCWHFFLALDAGGQDFEEQSSDSLGK